MLYRDRYLVFIQKLPTFKFSLLHFGIINLFLAFRSYRRRNLTQRQKERGKKKQFCIIILRMWSPTREENFMQYGVVGGWWVVGWGLVETSCFGREIDTSFFVEFPLRKEVTPLVHKLASLIPTPIKPELTTAGTEFSGAHMWSVWFTSDKHAL